MQNPAKVILRKNIKKLVQQMSAEKKAEQSTIVMQKLLTMPEFISSKRVSCYLSTDNEINTIPLLSVMFQQKKQVFVPTYSGNEMKMLSILNMEDYEKLPITKWKIKQPNPNDVTRENVMTMTDPLDIILIPGVSFSNKGDRLGHGMGYYDKYLHAYFNRFRNNNHQTVLIGLAFREQIVENLPTDENDWKLDIVLSA